MTIAFLLNKLDDLARMESIFFSPDEARECQQTGGASHEDLLPEDFVKLGDQVQLFLERTSLCLKDIRIGAPCNAGHQFHNQA